MRVSMGLSGGARGRIVGETTCFTMRALASLIPLLLIPWGGEGAAPPSGAKLHSNEGLPEDQKELIKMLSELAKLNLTSKELAELDPDKLLNELSTSSALDDPALKEKPPCKNFFWKTFSSC